MKQSKKARVYKKVPQEIRELIISAYFVYKQSSMQISKEQNINLSTVKSIINIYKKEGRSYPKIKKPRKAKTKNFHTKKVYLSKFLPSEITLSPPKCFFKSYMDCSINQKMTKDFKAISKKKSCNENQVILKQAYEASENEKNLFTSYQQNFSYSNQQNYNSYKNLLYQDSLISQSKFISQQQPFRQFSFRGNFSYVPNQIQYQYQMLAETANQELNKLKRKEAQILQGEK